MILKTVHHSQESNLGRTASRLIKGHMIIRKIRNHINKQMLFRLKHRSLVPLSRIFPGRLFPQIRILCNLPGRCGPAAKFHRILPVKPEAEADFNKENLNIRFHRDIQIQRKNRPFITFQRQIHQKGSIHTESHFNQRKINTAIDRGRNPRRCLYFIIVRVSCLITWDIGCEHSLEERHNHDISPGL